MRPIFQGLEQHQVRSALQGQEQQLQRRHLLRHIALILFLIIKDLRRESLLFTKKITIDICTPHNIYAFTLHNIDIRTKYKTDS